MAANLVKLSGNFLVASLIESLGEAVAFAAALGLGSLPGTARSRRR